MKFLLAILAGVAATAIFILVISTIWYIPPQRALAQVTTPLEAYIYGSAASTFPYASTLRIPVAPSASASSMQYIPANGANGITQLYLQVGSGTGNTVTANRGAFVCTTTCTVTPPVPAAGYAFCVWNDDNVSTVITLGALGSSAMYENTARTGYGTAGTGTLTSGGAVGDFVCLTGRDATHYHTVGFTGTWTAS